MDFLTPALLTGAGLAIAPVILHLIMRQRPRHLEFPALRFIQKRHDTNRRSLRLRHLLLLLLRAGAISLLALALARPTIQSAGLIGDREGPVAAALVFDTLPHMDYRHDNRTRIEAAQEVAAWLLARLPEESDIGVLGSDAQAPAFQIDRGAAKQRVEKLATSGVGQPLPRVIEAAMDKLRTSKRPREIYVFTDLARSSWRSSQEKELEHRLNELGNTNVYLIDVGVDHPQDFALAEPRLSNQVLPKNTPLRLSTQLSGIGVEGERIVESYLINAAGKAEKRGQEPVKVAAGKSTPLEIVLGSLDEGIHQGYLRILGEDGLAADDIRYFTAQVRSAWKVLVVAPMPRDEQAFYFTEALAPVAFRKNRQARFDCRVVGYDTLTAEKLENYAAVFLLDPPPLADPAWQQVGIYAASGGGVGIFLGDRAQPLGKFNSKAAAELLPGPLSMQAREPDGDVYLAMDESHHPALAKFEPLQGKAPWGLFPVFRYWQLEWLDGGPGVQVVLRYSDGRPAIVEKTLGRGRVLTMTTPVSERIEASSGDRWNLLPTGFEPWPFVMLANELAMYLTGGQESQLNYTAGQTAIVRLEGGQRFPTYQVQTPREQFLETAEKDGNTITVADTQLPGNYRVKAGGEQGVDLGFTVNLPPDATQLERLEPAELKQVFGDFAFKLVRGNEQIDREVQQGRVGRELFPILMCVIALVLALEHVMANRFYRENQQPA